MKKLLLGSILILLFSGCVSFPPLWGGEGPKVKELPPDVISIHNLTVLPSTSVRDKDEFSIYFELLNQDEFNDITPTYNIYDTGLCTRVGGDPDISVSSTGSFDPASFSPKETRLVEWIFKAPSAEEIANIRTVCPIKFKFDFSYNATSMIDILVVEKSHLLELQRSGTGTTFVPTVNVGRGPIKIYFDFGAALPVKNNYDLPVYLLVEDKGTGLLREIESNKFKVTFPPDFTVPDGGDTCPFFNCVGRVCTNNEVIPLINKKSLEIRCSGIKTPSTLSPGPEKTYFINAFIEYKYYTIGNVNVEVKP
ncbi:MAG: hypothetical protein GTN36_03570 [Candidatus Aenigmarchaeota archaeon]|nr:hypothetical protein [Candidatus Aenigmarchaeota archaeon]